MKRWLILILLFAITSVAGGKTLGIEAKEKVLKNGLKVIVVEDHSTPTVTFQVWYKVGSYYEQFGKTGISHLLEHMMFKGTKKYPTGEFSKIVSRNGGQEKPSPAGIIPLTLRTGRQIGWKFPWISNRTEWLIYSSIRRNLKEKRAL